MVFAELLGRYGTMWVRRRVSPGVLLTRDLAAPQDAPLLLLPNREVPVDVHEGMPLEVFVYLDSEDRPIATLRKPRMALGEVAFLECTDLTPFGAFFDWGLTKDLLVSKWQQTREVHLGERHPIGLVTDDSGRLAGTMRVSEMLDARPDAKVGDWVTGEAMRFEPGIGCFVIIDRKSVGLVPAAEPNDLRRGDAARFRVTAVFADGKVELSRRARAHEQLGDDGQLILAALRGPSPPRLGDHSHPDDVRILLGLSKKAFKRAVGGLLKERVVVIDGGGFVALAPTGATTMPAATGKKA